MKGTLLIKNTFRSSNTDQLKKNVTQKIGKLINRQTKKAD